MRVAFVTHSYRPYVGGVQHVVEEMAKGMARRGHEVEVLTLAPPLSFLPRTEKSDGYLVRRFTGLSPSNAYYLPTPSFVDAITRLDADIIHVHVVHSLVPLAAYVAKKLNRLRGHLIITPHFHGIGFHWHTGIAWSLYYPIVGEVLRSAEAVHSISPYEASLLGRFGVDPVIIPHGVSDDVLKYDWRPPEEPTVIYAGHLMRYKRVYLILEAINLLKEEVPQVRLAIVGGGPEKGRLVSAAKRLKLNVEFIPPLPRIKYLEQLANSTVMCYLSESEAFCVTVLESLAVGLPVLVVEPWGNFFEQYPRSTVLSSSPTPIDVANALISLLSKKLPPKPTITTWSQVTRSLEELYSRLYS